MHLKQYQDKVHRTPVSLTLSPDLQTQHLKGLQKYFNCFFFFFCLLPLIFVLTLSTGCFMLRTGL